MPRQKRADLAPAFAAPRQRLRGNRVQLSVILVPELANRVDAVARRKGLSRSALLTVWINEMLEREERGAR